MRDQHTKYLNHKRAFPAASSCCSLHLRIQTTFCFPYIKIGHNSFPKCFPMLLKYYFLSLKYYFYFYFFFSSCIFSFVVSLIVLLQTIRLHRRKQPRKPSARSLSPTHTQRVGDPFPVPWYPFSHRPLANHKSLAFFSPRP
jgi:hypothetical protein